MRRGMYSPETIAQASLEVAQDAEIGNSMLANRVREMISANEDPFFLVFKALGGRLVMERAERIRREQVSGRIRVE